MCKIIRKPREGARIVRSVNLMTSDCRLVIFGQWPRKTPVYSRLFG